MREQFEAEVYPVERRAIAARRRVIGDGRPVETSPTTRSELFGVALSGGGIRSAAFSLGALQALHKAGLGRRIDLLSTVSGGGFTGGWLQTLLASAKTWQKALETNAAVTHLRQRTSFVAPEGAKDWLTLVFQMLRGIAGNYLALLWLPVVIGLLVAWLWASRYADLSRPWHDVYVATPWAVVVTGVTFLASLLIDPWIGGRRRSPEGSAPTRRRREVYTRVLAGIAALGLLTVVLESAAAAVRIAHWVWSLPWFRSWPLAMGGVVSGLFLVTGSVALVVAGTTRSRLVRALAALVGVLGGILPGVAAGGYFAYLAAWWTPGHAGLSAHFGALLMVAAGLAALSAVIDPNFTSMHGAARDRLGTSFFVALRNGLATAEPNPLLSSMAPPDAEAPYPIITTTLNLQAVRDQALLGRSGETFVFTPHHFGSQRTGYAKLTWLEWVRPDMNLAAAVALSGAAASANMGILTRRLINPLLVLMNWRMGLWLPHPAHLAAFIRERARAVRITPDEVVSTTGDFSAGLSDRVRWAPRGGHLLAELVGAIGDGGTRVLLSDGGHIENTGIYELLRRRCRYILAIDGEGDPHYEFENLARVLRFARLDLGVEASIDLERLRPTGRFSRESLAVGTLQYPDGETGYLLVAKLCLPSDADPIVRSFADQNPSFPHDSTANQFFSEAQFEAYRSLGVSALAPLVERARTMAMDQDASLKAVLAPDAKEADGEAPADRSCAPPPRPPRVRRPRHRAESDAGGVGLALCLALRRGHPAPAGLISQHQDTVRATGPGPVGQQPQWLVRYGVADDQATGCRYVVFPGDDTPVAWFARQEVQLAEWAVGSGRVQAWTLAPFLAVWPEVARHITAHRGPLILVGHGVGGALAILCAARLGRRVDATYVAGTPRIGDHYFAGTLRDVSLVRIESVADPVPRHPAALCALGELRYLDSDGHVLDQPSRWRLRWDRLAWTLRARRFTNAHPTQDVGQAEHQLLRYYQRYTPPELWEPGLTTLPSVEAEVDDPLA